MTLWLLRPAWVSFKSDRNCRLQKLWLADKAIWKKTSNDVFVCVCMRVQDTKPAPSARQDWGKFGEMKYHQIPFVDTRNITRGRWGVSRRAVDEMCQALWAGCWRHTASSQRSGTIPASLSTAFPLLFWTELFFTLFLPPAQTDSKILQQNTYTEKEKKKRGKARKGKQICKLVSKNRRFCTDPISLGYPLWAEFDIYAIPLLPLVMCRGRAHSGECSQITSSHDDSPGNK